MDVDISGNVFNLIIGVMKHLILAMSFLAVISTMTSCNNSGDKCVKEALDNHFTSERKFVSDAIKHKSPDVYKVEVVDSSVIYTHIFDGIVDVKVYAFSGDECVEVERVYTFPDQMSALRHYRNAVERAELYDNIELYRNKVRYDLKKGQYELETKGLTKEQLKAKFDHQIADAKAHMKKEGERIEKDIKH